MVEDQTKNAVDTSDWEYSEHSTVVEHATHQVHHTHFKNITNLDI